MLFGLLRCLESPGWPQFGQGGAHSDSYRIGCDSGHTRETLTRGTRKPRGLIVELKFGNRCVLRDGSSDACFDAQVAK